MNLSNTDYKKVLDNLYDGIFFVNTDKEIIYWNRGAEEHTGYASDEVLGGQSCADTLKCMGTDGATLCETSCPVDQSFEEGRSWETEAYFHHKKGHRIPFSMRVAPMRNGNSNVVVAVELYHEHSPRFELRKRMERLEELVFLDPLTGVANRRYIEASIQSRLEELRRFGWSFGLLFLDVDNLKRVNDLHGHHVGDDVLRLISNTMLESLRSFDTIGRWAGDEFVATLVNVGEGDVYAIANRLRLLVEESSLRVGAESVGVTFSIGGTLATKEDTVKSLIERADRLMYRSKQSGRNCVTTEFA